jgi:hypothetical protein
MTDGMPNIKQSSNGTISAYQAANPNVEWYSSGTFYMEKNACLMQIDQFKALGWQTNCVGVGLGCDQDFMDRMARTAGTGVTDPSNPNGPKIAPYATGNPANYQQMLTDIFNNVVGAANVHLVQ